MDYFEYLCRKQDKNRHKSHKIDKKFKNKHITSKDILGWGYDPPYTSRFNLQNCYSSTLYINYNKFKYKSWNAGIEESYKDERFCNHSLTLKNNSKDFIVHKEFDLDICFYASKNLSSKNDKYATIVFAKFNVNVFDICEYFNIENCPSINLKDKAKIDCTNIFNLSMRMFNRKFNSFDSLSLDKCKLCVLESKGGEFYCNNYVSYHVKWSQCHIYSTKSLYNIFIECQNSLGFHDLYNEFPLELMNIVTSFIGQVYQLKLSFQVHSTQNEGFKLTKNEMEEMRMPLTDRMKKMDARDARRKEKLMLDRAYYKKFKRWRHSY